MFSRKKNKIEIPDHPLGGLVLLFEAGFSLFRTLVVVMGFLVVALILAAGYIAGHLFGFW